jgi:hypothetical protein
MSQRGWVSRKRARKTSAPALDAESRRGEARRWKSVGKRCGLLVARPAFQPSAAMTASAVVTTDTFCKAKLIEALCHSAFMVEQQSSGTIMK